VQSVFHPQAWSTLLINKSTGFAGRETNRDIRRAVSSKATVKLFSYAALFFFPLAGAAAEQPRDAIVREFLSAKAAAMRQGATAADVDKVLAYYTDDIIYEDPKVKVRVEGKEHMRSGMLSHVGDYAGKTRISVDQSISLANAVAAIVTEGFWVNGDSGRQKIQRQRLQVWEFRDDKICRVIDYH
jgi:ketosteroid isomerase-like protein